MKVEGLESVRHSLEAPSYFLKLIATPYHIVFFPGTIQHRDIGRPGISYEDDYQGNAMAGTITPCRIDFRYHSKYSEERVLTLSRNLLQRSEMAWAKGFEIRYQGRKLPI